jgi:hypothetical protein
VTVLVLRPLTLVLNLPLAVVVGHQVPIAFLDLQFLRVHLGNVLSSFLYAALFLATIPTRLLLEV